MIIYTNTVVSMTEANQNFTKVARTVDQFGKAIIIKNNSPKYMVLEFEAADRSDTALFNAGASDSVSYIPASREEVPTISKCLMEKYDEAYKELAK